MLFYYKKQWNNHLPFEKPKRGSQEPDQSWPKPPLRPGFWVLFSDDQYFEGQEVVGKIVYVTQYSPEDEPIYEVSVGYSFFSVKPAQIKHRMIRDGRDE